MSSIWLFLQTQIQQRLIIHIIIILFAYIVPDCGFFKSGKTNNDVEHKVRRPLPPTAGGKPHVLYKNIESFALLFLWCNSLCSCLELSWECRGKHAVAKGGEMARNREMRTNGKEPSREKTDRTGVATVVLDFLGTPQCRHLNHFPCDLFKTLWAAKHEMVVPFYWIS